MQRESWVVASATRGVKGGKISTEKGGVPRKLLTSARDRAGQMSNRNVEGLEAAAIE